MTKVLRGIVHGNTIEVSEDLGMWEGQTVDLLITPSSATGAQSPAPLPGPSPKKLPGPPPGWKPGAASSTAGMLAEEWTEEDDRILEQIQAERKSAKWRELPQ
jgi:hypothetical protein